MRTPITCLTAGVALTLLAAGAAQAQQPIYTGGERGSYFGTFGPLLQEILDREFFDYTLQTSAGSGENIDQVVSNPQAIGMTQTDVLAFQTSQDPTLTDSIVIIRNDVANECLYAVTSEENADRLTNWGDVRAYARRLQFAMGPEASGSARTFQFLQTFDERLAGAQRVSYMNSTDDAIDAVVSGDADVAFFVQFADPDNPRFETINDSRLAFIPVIDRSILRQRFDDSRAYVPLEVKVTSAGLLSWRGVERVLTACTPLAYITGDPALLPDGSEAQLDQQDMISILREASLEDLQPEADWFQTMLDDVVEVSGAGLDSMLTAVDDAAQRVID